MSIPESIDTEIIYLAAFERRRAENNVFAMVLTAAAADNPRMYDEYKINLPLKKDANFDMGSNEAVQFALGFINPYEPTVIRHSLPYLPSLDLSFYKELSLQAIDREDNHAWHALLRATRGIKPGTI